MRSYDKAVDDYECFQIFTDSLVVTVSQEAEVNAGKLSHTKTGIYPQVFLIRASNGGALCLTRCSHASPQRKEVLAFAALIYFKAHWVRLEVRHNV